MSSQRRRKEGKRLSGIAVGPSARSRTLTFHTGGVVEVICRLRVEILPAWAHDSGTRSVGERGEAGAEEKDPRHRTEDTKRGDCSKKVREQDFFW